MHAQVTRSMFDKALPDVERAIEQCHYYAFDLEMTGLHVSDQRESWVDDMEDRYKVVSLLLNPAEAILLALGKPLISICMPKF